MSNEFDKECCNRYGKHTCILYEINNVKFEVRKLDLQMPLQLIDKQGFFEMIPKLLVEKYTVVIVEKGEITSVHLPVQSQLATPPIIQ